MLTSENGFKKKAFMPRGKVDRYLNCESLESLERYSIVYL